jgi:hypothetical protein
MQLLWGQKGPGVSWQELRVAGDVSTAVCGCQHTRTVLICVNFCKGIFWQFLVGRVACSNMAQQLAAAALSVPACSHEQALLC